MKKLLVGIVTAITFVPIAAIAEHTDSDFESGYITCNAPYWPQLKANSIGNTELEIDGHWKVFYNPVYKIRTFNGPSGTHDFWAVTNLDQPYSGWIDWTTIKCVGVTK